MARIVKLIWRLDYESSYAFLNQQGEALRILNTTIEGFWDNVGVGALPSSFIGHRKRDRCAHFLSLEITSMNGAIEWLGGNDLDKALGTEAFRAIDRITAELLKLCEIRAVTRAGLRLGCVAKFAHREQQAQKRIQGLLSNSLKQKTVTALGPIKDVAITFEGTTPDNVNYRSTFGPYERKNIDLLLQGDKPTDNEYKLLDESDLFFDIDLFEKNFSFKEHKLYRWSSTKVDKALDLIKVYSEIEPQSSESTNDRGRKSS
jgi:hypothetical protein